MNSLDQDTAQVSPQNRNTLLTQYSPYLTVFVSSASIMVIELVAGRIVSRFIGQSLYTWTTIIGVVLAGISLGNYLGGRLADRSWGRSTLALQFLLAAAGCVSVLGLNTVVGHWLAQAQWPWPLRIFTHVTLVFILPATLLGTISPVIAKRALKLGHATGRTMGNVYAWSIAGSILGTFLTGFYLLTVLGATAVATGAAGILALLGLVYALGAVTGREAAGSVPGDERPRALPDRVHASEWSFRDLFVFIATVFMANGCVMMMEAAAGRMISRNYGQSLYTWTTVIGVVLAGMTLGSHFAGRLADRFRADRMLALLFTLSSVSCVAVTAINNFFVTSQVLMLFSWPMQIAIHVTAAFLLPSLLIGAISPVTANAALQRGHATGRTVGDIYAWGSVGSIVGTFLAGYVLIEAIGMVLTLYTVAGVLAILAALYGRHMRLAYVWAPACGVAILGAMLPWAGVRDLFQTLALREEVPYNVVYVDESQYSYITVLAEPDLPNIRQMALDRLVHSRVNLDDPRDLRYEYEWVYSAVLDKCFPDPNARLATMVIGGGGYAFPHYLEVTRPAGYVEVPEIDPAVTEAAHAACGLPRDTTVKTFNLDARNRVDDLLRRKRAGESVPVFDCIMGDSINDYSVPYHLTTREFNEGLKELLAPSGIYMLNLIDMLDSGQFLGAVTNTCRMTWPYVYVFSSFDIPYSRDTFIVVCSSQPLDVTGFAESIRAQHPYAGDLLSQAAVDDLIARTGSRVLTDDFAPVDNMMAPVVRLSQDMPVVVYLKAADELLGEERYDAAIKKARHVLRLSPRSAQAHEVIGIGLTRKGDLAGAIPELQEATVLDPQRVTAFDNLGQALYASGDLAGAVNAWNTAIQISPDYAPPYESLGGALVRSGDLAGALPKLTKAIELNPQSVSAHNNMAVALYGRGDYEGAIREFTAVLAIDPNYAGIHFQLAVSYFRKKAYDNAWAEVQKALEGGETVDQKFIDDLKRESGKSQ